MTKLICVENRIDQNKRHFGSFLFEPLEVGQGITLGNTLRRTLLSDLSGFAITGARINNLKHEFGIIEGIREDILEILLNLKELAFKSSLATLKAEKKIKSYIKIKGPAVITAGLFNLPKNSLRIVNPNQYICTLLDNSDLYLEIDIERGKGYNIIEENYNLALKEKFAPKEPSTMPVDALFMPVKRVNYKVKLIHDTQGNIKESLQLNVLTNGSTTPSRCVQEGLKIIANLICPFFDKTEFQTITSELTRNLYK